MKKRLLAIICAVAVMFSGVANFTYRRTHADESQVIPIAMALDNNFADLDEHVSVKRNLREYIPLAVVGSIAVYRHKSNRRYYVTGTKAGVFKNEFADTDKDRLAFIRTYPLLYDLYLKRKIDFSDYASEAAFRKLY